MNFDSKIHRYRVTRDDKIAPATNVAPCKSDLTIGLGMGIDNSNLKPNVIVAKDGNSQFKTIGATSVAAPKNSNIRHVIYIKAGIYVEYIAIDKQYTIIIMYSDGPRKTIVISRKGVKNGSEITTWQTATFCKYPRTLIILFFFINHKITQSS
ncbi:hypothetical protein PVK06_004046 [Gossypium arboreum]|uniref:Pectinesterase n=1 Tax=Gossypium arboreum TaxID=29729 RepID=A0ABR0QQW8_GOSAR|nr:hypothetical protein PVK06_004046 [Gossypium arboreum]